MNLAEKTAEYFKSQSWYDNFKENIGKTDSEIIQYIFNKIESGFPDSILEDAFNWKNSPEGYDFWLNNHMEYDRWLCFEINKLVEVIFNYIKELPWFPSFKKYYYKFSGNRRLGIKEKIFRLPEDFICKSFIWDSTKEGYDYWNTVYNTYTEWYHSII